MKFKITNIVDEIDMEIELFDIISATKSSEGCFIELEDRKTLIKISESNYQEIMEKSLIN